MVGHRLSRALDVPGAEGGHDVAVAADGQLGGGVVGPAAGAGDTQEDGPEGAEELGDERVAEGGVEEFVEVAVEFGDGFARPPGRLHPVDDGRESVQFVLREGARDPSYEAVLQDLADLEDLGERGGVAVGPGEGAEGEPVDEGGEGGLADVGAVAVPDVDYVEGLQGFEGLADGVAADAEVLHQLRLGGQGRARLELAVEDELRDLALDLAAHPTLGPAPAPALLRHAPHRTLAGHPTSHLRTETTWTDQGNARLTPRVTPGKSSPNGPSTVLISYRC